MTTIKLVGLYQLLNPNSPKIFGFNIFKIIGTFQLMYNLIFSCLFFICMYYCSNDINEVTRYVMLFTGTFFSVSKYYYIIKNSDIIWKCLHLTFLNFLSSKNHKKRTFQDARANTISLTRFFIFLYTISLLAWVLVPLLNQNNFLILKIGNETHRYRFNTVNLILPVFFNDKFYNDNFMAFYIFESFGFLFYVHSSFGFDMLVISMCMAIKYQLQTIADSYTTSITKIQKVINSNLGK